MNHMWTLQRCSANSVVARKWSDTETLYGNLSDNWTCKVQVQGMKQKSEALAEAGSESSDCGHGVQLVHRTNQGQRRYGTFGRKPWFPEWDYCGWRHRKGQQSCPAAGKTCTHCGKLNHFALQCRSRTRGTRANIDFAASRFKQEDVQPWLIM